MGAGGTRQLTTVGRLDSGSNTPDGTILLTIGQPTRTNLGATGRDFPPIQPGETFTLVNGITQQSGGVLLLTTDSTDNGTYAVAGNASCAPNAAPIAALVASPLTGTAPLPVTFDATGSSDPDSDAIVSYQFDYGDGTTETKTVPTASHTYRDSGIYSARVTVTDARGLASSNTAEAVIQVASTLQGVVSRKQHGTTGQFDVPLPLGGPAGIECRNDGSNSHTVVFTFSRDLTEVTSSSVTQGTATKTAEGIGPQQNQYTVQLGNVTNAQSVAVTLNGVKDTAGANLTGVKARMAVLQGDVNGSRVVDGNDVSSVQSKTRQVADSTNFKRDVNVSGNIDGNDVSLTQSQTRTRLP